MKFIDSHSHIYDKAYSSEEELIISRADEAGVDRMIVPDATPSERQRMFDLCDRYPDKLFPCIGIHPTEFGDNWRADFEELKSWKTRKIKAIGEIGMDLHWSKDRVEEQKELFAAQLELAHEMDLPVIIHCREASEVCLDVLKANSYSGLRGVFHAFSGSIETWREIQKTGDWYAGIGGVLTFKKASIAETVKGIELDRILLETDAPYLPPVPHRGERNESSYIPIIAAKLAQIKETSLEEVAEITTANCEKLFAL